MIEFAVSVQRQRITCEKVRGELVSGLQGVKVRFTWSGEWRQLRRIAVFRAGSMSRNVMDLENECEIPWEVLAEPGHMLMIGIQGTNEEGTAVTPTLEAEMGEIQQGANPSDDPTADPTMPAWKWLEGLINKAISGIENLLKSGREEIDQTVADGKSEIDAIAKQMQEMIDNGNIVVQPGEDGQARAGLRNHIDDKNNPHGVKPAQIGAMATTGGVFTGMVTLNGMRVTKNKDYGLEPPEDMEEGRVFLLEDPTDDRIVEYGRTDGWQYWKLQDGTAVCWKTVSQTVVKTVWKKNANDPAGSYWTSGMTLQFAYPFGFAEHPAEYTTIANASTWDAISCIARTNGAADKTDSYRLVTGKLPTVDLNVTVAMLAVGRWK